MQILCNHFRRCFMHSYFYIPIQVITHVCYALFSTFIRHENEHERLTDDRLPDIMWCRDPFMEALNEIDDIK